MFKCKSDRFYVCASANFCPPGKICPHKKPHVYRGCRFHPCGEMGKRVSCKVCFEYLTDKEKAEEVNLSFGRRKNPDLEHEED